MTKDACRFIGSFPSVAAVDQMAYSEEGEWTVVTDSRLIEQQSPKKVFEVQDWWELTFNARCVYSP